MYLNFSSELSIITLHRHKKKTTKNEGFFFFFWRTQCSLCP